MNPENASNSSHIHKKSTWKELIREVIIFILIAFGIVLPFRMYIAEPYLVDGRSMDPTFATGQYLIVNKISYELSGNVSRNSVLVFKYPGDTSKNFIKRVIGLPGETVKIVNGEVTIINSENPDGIKLDQSFIKYPSPNDNMTVKLAGDEYFVMGDNRAESFDSRLWGPLNKKYILGEPIIRLFPFDKIAVVPGKK